MMVIPQSVVRTYTTDGMSALEVDRGVRFELSDDFRPETTSGASVCGGPTVTARWREKMAHRARLLASIYV